jgi:pimeloyl-ACP methyl ester carboxylesterase
MVPGAGHYPHAEDPERVALAVVSFLRDSVESFKGE